MTSKTGNILVIILIILNLLVLGAFGFWFYQEKVIKKSDVSVEEPEKALLESPQPSPSLEPEEMPEVTESAQEQGDLEQIRAAFAEKYDRPIEEVNVTINQNTGLHAQGSISFADEMGGGMWLAYNGAGGWIIVFDGHGTIPCSDIEPYDFPIDLVPECFDEETGSVIIRE